MFKINFREILLSTLVILLTFLIDRISKIYIIKIAELDSTVDIYLTPFLNFYLIWNKGIAFGLLSFNQTFIYNVITTIIIVILFVILVMICRSKGLKRYSLLFVFGGSIGNLFDRIYYSAVPDFIDFHISNFHWFIFNVADIFISLGIITLIFIEIFSNKKNKKID